MNAARPRAGARPGEGHERAAGSKAAAAREADAAAAAIDDETKRRALEDGYRLLQEIGSGAVSTVYAAEQLEAGTSRVRRRVALKVLRPTIAPTSSFAEPMVREARLLEELGHPNVVRMIASVRREDRLSIALELVEGDNLAQLLAREPRLPVERAVDIALQVARGLAYLHGRGVVHRDVKPQNILVSRTGEVKLADLGIADILPGSPLAQSPAAGPVGSHGRKAPRREGVSFGTPAYMAPEALLADGVAPADPRSDLFSLGVTLYEALSAARPFEADPSAPDVVAIGSARGRSRARREKAEPLARRAPETPREVERLVMQLVERRPGDRFASADEVVRALERAEVEVRRSERAARRRWLGQSPAVLACAAALLLVSLGALGMWRRHGRAASVSAGGGQVQMIVRPWAEVWIDGAHVETTPVARLLPLPEGAHEVLLKNPYFVDERRQVLVSPAQTSVVDVTMSQALDAGPAEAAR